MNTYYDVHSWSKLYREERLSEAQARRLIEQARRNLAPRSLRDHASLAWSSVVSVVRSLSLSG
jgi:hypothetical protein